jgi:exodeoxyribonuclease VIII
MKSYPTGIYDISNDEYHSSNGVSRSQLMRLNKSPQHYWYEYLNPLYIKPEPTEAMKIGSATHKYILEKNKFYDEYLIIPKLDKRIAKNKEIYANLALLNPDKILIQEDDFEEICAYEHSIKNHIQASQLMMQLNIEKSLYWTDKETGIDCKVRPDGFDNNFVIDLKTTEDASIHAFKMSCFKYGYYLQAGMTLEAFRNVKGMDFDEFLIIVLEKKKPYPVAVYIMDIDAIEYGVKEFKRLLKKLKECMDKNEWPGYETQYLTVPGFTKFEEKE